MSALRIQVLEPLKKHRSTVLWLHGLGDNSAGFADIFKHVVQPVLPHTRFVLPNAPTRPITVNMGMEMPGWYDIVEMGAERIGGKEDDEGIDASALQLDALLSQEVERVGDARGVAVGGFSQGGAMSVRLAMQFPHKLGGVVAASAYVLQMDRLLALQQVSNATTPFLTVHGKQDAVVPFGWARNSFQTLKDKIPMTNMEFHDVDQCGHEFPISTAQHVAQFLKESLGDHEYGQE